MVLGVWLNFVSSEPLANEFLGMTLIDRSHTSTPACFSTSSHGEPHQKCPSLFFFAFVENIISSFKAQSNASQKSLFTAAHILFSFLRKILAPNLHTTEFSPWLHIPLVPYVPERQHGAVKRAYNLGPEPIISLLCNPEDLCKAARTSLLIHLSSCIVLHWMMSNHFFPQTSTDGQWATSGFLTAVKWTSLYLHLVTFA